MNRSTLLRDCLTGNCTFAADHGFSHETMGLCSVCEDTTNLVTEVITAQKQVQVLVGLDNRNVTQVIPVTSHLLLPNGQNLTNASVAVVKVAAGVQAFENMTFGDGMSAILDIALSRISILAFTSTSCKYTTIPRGGYWNCTNGIETNPSSGWDQVNVISTACAIYPCMRQYNASVENGILTETLIKSKPALSGTGIFPPLYGIKEPCVSGSTGQDVSGATGPILDDSISDLDPFAAPDDRSNLTAVFNGERTTIPNSCISYVSQMYQLAMSQLLAPMLSGTCGLSETRMGIITSLSPEFRARLQCSNSLPAATSSTSDTNAASGGWWLQNLNNNGNATFDSINQNVRVIADALTDRLRLETFNASDARTFVQGTVMQSMVCTRMAWEWLILPAALLLLTTVFLIYTITWTYIERIDVPLWKSSVLPLIYGPSDDVRSAASGTVEVMHEEARTTDVQIRNNMVDGSWQLTRRASNGRL